MYIWTAGFTFLLPVNVEDVGTASGAGLIFWSQTLAANVRLGIHKTKKKILEEGEAQN